MSSKPSFTPPVGAIVKISIPPEWFINISAISRKNYNQGVFIQTNIRNNSSFFISENGKNGPMRDSAFGLFTFPIAPRQTPVDLDLSVYFADTAEILTAKKLRVPNYSSSKLDVQKSEKPEDASDDIPDYVTFFIFVEDTPDNAQVAGSGQFDDQVITIHVVKTNPNKIPPPPPPNVIKPYNPILDLPRPSKLENYLKQYDVTFLIDDSPSMADENRWVEASNALNGLANYVIDSGFDANGIDLAFLNSDFKFLFKDEINDVTDKGKVAAALAKVGPNGQNGTPTGQRCSEILNKHLDRLDAVKGTQAYAEIKPLDLIVITDGVPNDKDPNLELTKVLIDVGARIRKQPTPHHPNSLGVQFVQIGNDPFAATALPKLVQADTGSIVDTVPYAGAGSISPDKLERILLGGLHPNIRAQNVI